MRNIIYLLLGLIIGSASTYFLIDSQPSKPIVGTDYNGDGYIEPSELPVGHPNSPFSGSSDDYTEEDSIADMERSMSSGQEYVGDMNNLGDRDVSIAVWYANQAKVVGDLEAYTGHKFKPVWNRRHPLEILEEQTSFMKEFFAKSKKLEQEQK